jgi:octaheme c-type cytochrome (tetrathionate reductase family)
MLLAALVALALQAPAGARPAQLESTADHSKFEQLQGPFASGPDVTKACLSCHTEAARQIHRTKHWSWEFDNPDSGQRLGKKNVLNNFCISIEANTPYCTSCHVGYGWKDASFDFASEQNVDCLVCHDTTGNYRKFPGFAGHPLYAETQIAGRNVRPADLARVAQRVGKTSRDTCGSCHFFGGGGDGVKHGDMDSSLAAPDRELDVHMDALGLDFSCSTCHMTSAHDVPGSRYTPVARDDGGAHLRGAASSSNPTTCVACHGNAPHPADPRLDHHARKIACQTCHVPSYSRGGVATKMGWDWSTAGQLSPEGKPIQIRDDQGRVQYDSRKGDFTYGEFVIPDYVWFDGKVSYTLLEDTIDPSAGPVGINRLGGAPADPASMIWPVKVFRGKQPYDPVNMTLVKPHTAGNDENAYWKNFGWEKSIESGMTQAGASFSGEVAFIETTMSWPIKHMVAPKEHAVACVECHTRENGRLAGLPGVYLPGRDRLPVLDATMGWLAILALLGVIVHGGGRIATRKSGPK